MCIYNNSCVVVWLLVCLDGQELGRNSTGKLVTKRSWEVTGHRSFLQECQSDMLWLWVGLCEHASKSNLNRCTDGLSNGYQSVSLPSNPYPCPIGSMNKVGREIGVKVIHGLSNIDSSLRLISLQWLLKICPAIAETDNELPIWHHSLKDLNRYLVAGWFHRASSIM